MTFAVAGFQYAAGDPGHRPALRNRTEWGMRLRWLYLLLGMHACGAWAEASAAAPTVKCESRDGGMVRCPLPADGPVQMVRQLSDTACIRGSRWGTYDGGVWVTQGCRAEFMAAAPEADPGLVRRVLRCESNGGVQSCPVRLRGAPVRLLRQRSALPCREGRTWGVRRNEVWVSRGCDGDFEIGNEQGGFVDVPWLVSCESKGSLRRTCGASIAHGATLYRQLSRSPCVEGRSWGWDQDGVWVDEGCRAEFSVR